MRRVDESFIDTVISSTSTSTGATRSDVTTGQTVLASEASIREEAPIVRLDREPDDQEDEEREDTEQEDKGGAVPPEGTPRPHEINPVEAHSNKATIYRYASTRNRTSVPSGNAQKIDEVCLSLNLSNYLPLYRIQRLHPSFFLSISSIAILNDCLSVIQCTFPVLTMCDTLAGTGGGVCQPRQ